MEMNIETVYNALSHKKKVGYQAGCIAHLARICSLYQEEEEEPIIDMIMQSIQYSWAFIENGEAGSLFPAELGRFLDDYANEDADTVLCGILAACEMTILLINMEENHLAQFQNCTVFKTEIIVSAAV